jgi:hypothetical protein
MCIVQCVTLAILQQSLRVRCHAISDLICDDSLLELILQPTHYWRGCGWWELPSVSHWQKYTLIYHTYCKLSLGRVSSIPVTEQLYVGGEEQRYCRIKGSWGRIYTARWRVFNAVEQRRYLSLVLQSRYDLPYLGSFHSCLRSLFSRNTPRKCIQKQPRSLCVFVNTTEPLSIKFLTAHLYHMLPRKWNCAYFLFHFNCNEKLHNLYSCADIIR